MKGKITTSRKAKSLGLNILVYLAAGVTCALLLSIIVYIFYRGLPHITWELLSREPSLLYERDGILPNILNTLYIVFLTLLIVLPLGVGAAVYLTEYSKAPKLNRIIEFAADTLSGIPSIIYGLVGMLFFVRFCSLGTSLLAGSLTMVMVTLPTVIRTTQESLKSVQSGLREGALALGSGKWHMIRTVVLPSSVDGIVTGCILAVGRIMGESAALLFTAGMANDILSIAEAVTPKSPGSTLSVALYMYAKERGEFEIAFAIAAILLILTLIINICAKAAALILKKRK